MLGAAILTGVMTGVVFLVCSLFVDGWPEDWRKWVFTLGLSAVWGLVAGFFWPLVVGLIIFMIMAAGVAVFGLSILLHSGKRDRKSPLPGSP